MTLALFALVVFVAFVVEATAGFGATVVTVTLASQLLPIPEVLAALVPVNLLLSGYLVTRHWRHVDGRLLARRVLPFMGVGMAAGMSATAARDAGWMKPAFAIFVLVLAAVELARATGLIRPGGALRPGAGPAALVGGGVIHGLFACGGPLAVYVLGREVGEKARFRATLSALWLVLNSVLIVQYVWAGTIGATSMQRSGVLVASLGLGLVVGELTHARLDERRFRLGVFALLLVAATALLASSLGG